MKRTLILAFLVPAFIATVAYWPVDNHPEQFHTDAELALFRQINGHGFTTGGPGTGLLPIDSNILFPISKTCAGCHGHDLLKRASVTSSGIDVNVYDDWRSTMMANSSKDPFWRAKVRHEILVNPSHSLELQTKCTSCHAPAGHYQAKLKRHAEHYLLSDLYQDTLGLDGVTCQICHAQSIEKLGDLHSGSLNFDTNHIRVANGPYEMVFSQPMHEFVGITPMFGDQVFDAGLCAGCHTLITETADLNGELTGGTFVEQATYHEWLNSAYDENHENINCQNCHIPQLLDEIIISANYQFLTPKFPFGLHELAGANVTMLRMLRDNREKLGIEAEAALFDSTIQATLRMLQQHTLDLKLETGDLTGDSAHFYLTLTNKAGHKFPSGYPSRRAWVEFEVKKENGEVLFVSGKMNPDFTLAGEKPGFEPHYDHIGDPSQVQIYEMVPGDVAGQFTNVLERAKEPLKDNRLVPRGFTMSDPVYDTTRIAGDALNDPNFNRLPNGAEGSGSDQIEYAIPMQGYTGKVTVSARVWYQSLPPKWMAPIFEWSAPEIDTFKQMFESADLTPVLVAEQKLENLAVSAVSVKNPGNMAEIRVFPSISLDGRVHVWASPGVVIRSVKVWNAAGNIVWQRDGNAPVQLPDQKGVYFVLAETSTGKRMQKVVRN